MSVTPQRARYPQEGLRFQVPLDAYPMLEAVGDDSVVFFSTYQRGPDWRCEDSL